MWTDCQRIIIFIHLLLYYSFQSLPDHLHPNLLAHQLLAPQYLAPWFLAPQRSLPNLSLPLITSYSINHLISPTRYLVFCCTTCSMIAWFLFLWFSNSPLAITNWKIPYWSSITLVFCCWLFIDVYLWTHIYYSHWPGPWSADIVTGILLSNIPLIFEKILALPLHNW